MKWIEHYVEREAAGAQKRVEDVETAIRQEQQDTDASGNWELTTRGLEKTLLEMILAMGDNLSDIGSSDDGEDGAHEDNEETVQGQLCEVDEHGWVMGTMNKKVPQHMERFRLKQMKLDELTQPGWEDTANYFHEGVKMYCISELRVQAVIQSQTKDDAAEPAPTSFGQLIHCLDNVPGISQMLQWTS